MRIYSVDGPTHKDSSYFVYDSFTCSCFHYESERYSRFKESPDDPYYRLIHSNPIIDSDDVFSIIASVTNISHSQKELKAFIHPSIKLNSDSIIQRNSVDFLLNRPAPGNLKIGDGWIHPLLLSQSDLSPLTNHPTWIISHHLAHASHGFCSSEFDEAVVFTIDGGGPDWGQDVLRPGEKITKPIQIITFTAWHYTRSSYECLAKFDFNSVNIGVAYNAITSYILGSEISKFGGNQCGTLMAMASLYSPYIYLDLTRTLVRISNKDKIIERLTKLFGEKPSEDLKFSLAASMQLATEEYCFDLMKPYFSKSKNIVLSGGVALNSVMTGRMYKKLAPKGYSIYIPPVPYDAGLTIGAAQHLLQYEYKEKSFINAPMTSYLGSNYSNDEIKRAINDQKALITVAPHSIQEICSKISNGYIVAIFTGKSESGRRALGNRSIIADPRNQLVKDLINEKIKHRQWYRPFAPIVLSKYADSIFDDLNESPYMSFIASVKPIFQGKYPGIVHTDGTARVQTINDDQPYKDSFILKLLNEFYNLTGSPILLNTSFNDREPIVETPDDAISCFLKTQIDYLYFADLETLVARDKNINSKSTSSVCI